jgi:hypothetical protein
MQANGASVTRLPNLAPSKQTLFNPRTQSSPTIAPTVAPPIIEVKAPIWLSAPASQWPCLRSPHSLGKTRHESERRNGMNPAVGAIKLWSTPRLAPERLQIESEAAMVGSGGRN